MTPEEWKELQERVAAMEKFQERGSAKPGWKDPTCPKCGIVLGNRMSYACGNSYCPSGLN